MKTVEQLDMQIKILDRDIEGRERRLSMVRQYRERLYIERAGLDAPADKFEERDNARLEKPRGKCVTLPSKDGTLWKV
jgi:hypothetical protein